MTFPTTPILDNFNRGNGAIGADWIDSTSRDPFVINTGRMYYNNTENGLALNSWHEQLGPDVEAYYTLSEYSSESAAFGIDFQVRAQDTETYFDDCYDFALGGTPNSPGAGNYAIYWIHDSGIYDNLASGSLTISDGDQFGILIIGTEIKIYQNHAGGGWVEIDSATDSNISGAGYVKIVGGIGNTGSIAFDDFGGGTITGPVGITADLDVTLDDMTLSSDAVLERLADLDVTLDDMTLVSDAFVRTYIPPILMNTRISVAGGIGVEVSAGSGLIAHVHQITAATSIKVSGGATAKVIGNQFDPSVVSVTGTLEYLQGDRSAWDMANYAARHASDINAATFAYHRNPALSGTYTVSNPVTLRTIDLNSFTLNELAAIVGTLLADLGMT